MEKFTTLEGVAAPLQMINVDTDMIIPKQYLKTIKRTGLGNGPVLGEALSRRRQREPGFRAQQAGLSQGQDPGRRRQFRLRLLARARALGADGFRHSLRDLDLVRRHLLQQLLQERRAADQGIARRIWRNCSTTPSAAPMRRCRSTWRSRRSVAPTAAWSSSTSTRTASIACSTASTTSGSPWSRRTRSSASSRSPRPRAPGRSGHGVDARQAGPGFRSRFTRAPAFAGSRRLDVGNLIEAGLRLLDQLAESRPLLANSGEWCAAASCLRSFHCT